MPYTQPQENFFKLFTLVYLHGTNISRQLLQMFIDSKRFTFEAFINNHQHELYHFSSNTLCCQCEKNTILPKKLLLDKTQMLIIFDKDSIRIDKHEQQKQGLCCLKANKNVKLDDLDLTFIRFFIVNFCCQIFWECHLQYAKKCISVFLNDNVHKVYHLAFANVCCCKCNNDRDISHQRRITESQFGIIFDTDGKTCHRYCSCQYRIKEGISLSLLIDQDKKLYTEITKYFCSCQKHFEDIIAIRNEIAHASFAFITNDEKLSKLWTATANNILAIANVLGVNDKYEPQLLELKEECSHSYYQKCIIDLIKTSEHFDPAIVQRIDNSTEETKFRVVMACLEEFLSSASNRNVQSGCHGCVATIEDRLTDFALSLRKEYTEESSSQYQGETEVSVIVEILTSTHLHDRGSEDEYSDQDEPDILTCGKCKAVFNKLNDFEKHKRKRHLKDKKERNSATKKIYKVKIGEAGKEWPTDAMNAFKNEPNCFDTENTTVCLMGKGCLIVWAESPISDLDSKDKVTEHCIQFTRNMFKKCSLYSIETANVNVTVKYSELHEESGNDEDDHLECGKCGRVCLSINSFISHKKECVRNLKRRNKQDGLKGDISSVLNSKQSRTGRISKDEENFLRIAVLIIRVASAAVRNTFIKTFHGNALTKTLFEDPTVWVSTAQDKIMSQYDLQQIILHGRSGVASVYSFSLKLMIWLIRYRTARDEDRALQDDPKHISVRDGLSRILKYKNEITRMKYPKLQEEKLEQYWTNISQAIVRLGGEGFQQKCNDLKVSILNENYIEMLTEIIEIVKSDDSNTQGFKRLLDNLFSPRTSPDPNYIRIADLLLRVGPPAVRILFDREFHPKFLQRELRKKTARLAHLKGKGMINAAQWDKLFKSKDENKSKTFDLSLMICLIRNFTNIQVTDQLPGPDDDSEGAALSRLEYYRKHIAYSQECDLSFTVFGRYWADITNAIFKIGGNKFLQRCNVLKMGKLIQKDKAILPEPTSRDIPN